MYYNMQLALLFIFHFRVTFVNFQIRHAYALVHLPNINKYDFSKLAIGKKYRQLIQLISLLYCSYAVYQPGLWRSMLWLFRDEALIDRCEEFVIPP